ncbi:hypothetical protein HVIM_04288 [Roseomonas mucosa]|nr:hypothetical protein HVIM_04288 [Roseomonas mucosa]QDE00949.1 hypothetical protein ADP8_04288 [Roseomonas mucosa]
MPPTRWWRAGAVAKKSSCGALLRSDLSNWARWRRGKAPPVPGSGMFPAVRGFRASPPPDGRGAALRQGRDGGAAAPYL